MREVKVKMADLQWIGGHLVSHIAVDHMALDG